MERGKMKENKRRRSRHLKWIRAGKLNVHFSL